MKPGEHKIGIRGGKNFKIVNLKVHCFMRLKHRLNPLISME